MSNTLRPIEQIAGDLGLPSGDLFSFGPHMAKVDLSVLQRARTSAGPPRVVLVSAMSPTPAGEGKTTTSIGLAQGLRLLGERVCVALREPSLGPCLGRKGGATGGGASRVHPESRIDLHFTGDLHAVTAANNFLCSVVDDALHRGRFGLDVRKIPFRRVIDLNDRALRSLVVALGGTTGGVPRETGFDATAASEVMAVLCLARDLDDLRARIGRIVLGFTGSGDAVTAEELGATGAVMALLHDAVRPNLVQTTEGVPALIHGGPFANIAHGCNSVLALRMAMHCADWVVTEAGFGFDLGGEKFLHLVRPVAGADPVAVVLVVSLRALRYHGGATVASASQPDESALRAGLANLDRHVESIRAFGLEPIVAVNRFQGDTDAEIDVVREHSRTLEVAFAVSDHFARGGEGARELADCVRAAGARPAGVRALYQSSDSFEDKLNAIATRVYGARRVRLSAQAQRELRRFERLGLESLPPCVAKTPASLSHDPVLRGRPEGFDLPVRSLALNAGAGFLVALAGEILRLPGLPAEPHYRHFDLEDGEPVGVED